MNNFQKFYFDITGFRDEMKGAVKRYQVTIKELNDSRAALDMMRK